MPRRRRRLGHLSNDQKMLRRKLKNRVAAQNARDKKKTESENLKLENEKLLRLVHKLQTENLQREVIFVINGINSQKTRILGIQPTPEHIIYLNSRMNWSQWLKKIKIFVNDWVLMSEHTEHFLKLILAAKNRPWTVRVHHHQAYSVLLCRPPHPQSRTPDRPMFSRLNQLILDRLQQWALHQNKIYFFGGSGRPYLKIRIQTINHTDKGLSKRRRLGAQRTAIAQHANNGSMITEQIINANRIIFMKTNQSVFTHHKIMFGVHQLRTRTLPIISTNSWLTNRRTPSISWLMTLPWEVERL